MTVARISNFLQNSDFTTQKQKNKIYFELNIPAGSYKTVARRQRFSKRCIF